MTPSHSSSWLPVTTLLFDLDGTLVDTEKMAAQTLIASFRSWGVSLQPESSQVIAGKTWESAFAYLRTQYELPISWDDAAAQILQSYRTQLQSQVLEVPGAAQRVREFHQSKKFKMGLVSGSHRQEILTALDHLGVRDCFEVILGAEDYPRSKPAPDGYLLALKLLNKSPQETLVFEDSSPGIASAIAAKTRVAAITSTNHFGQSQAQAHAFFQDWHTLTLEWIERFPLFLTRES